MRHLGIVLVLISLPALAAAQHRGERARTPPPAPAPATSALGSIGLPLPSIGLPLPSIGLPLRTLGLSPVPDGIVRPAPEYLPGNRYESGRRHRPRSSIVYVVPTYGFGGAMPVHAATPPAPAPVTRPETGRLRFEVEPSHSLQVLVDGVFVGTPGDLGHEVDLRPGARRMEFRAPGHEPLVVDVRIVQGQSVTYRGALTPIARTEPPAPASPPPPPPVPAAGSMTLYVIPGCYLGNVRPQEERLPEGCDLSRLTVRTP